MPTKRAEPPKVTRMFTMANGGHWYKLDGHKVPGVTTILNGGVPKPAIKFWAAKAVAEFAVLRRVDWQDLEPDEALDLLKKAPDRDMDRAARRGTEVHHYAEQLLAGRTVEIPDELAGHVDSYIGFVHDWAPHCLMCERPVPCECGDEFIERVITNRAYQYMGRLDGGFILPELGRTLLDLKTNRSGIFPETALQLAAYRFAETFLDEAQELEYDMPRFDNCAALWVRADGYDLIPVDAGPTQFRTFLYAQQVAQWVTAADNAKRNGDGPIGDPLSRPGPTRLEVVS